MATLPVKWFHSGMAGAPILSNNNGDLTSLLDAILVNGFNSKPVTSITRVDTTVTVECAGHGFVVDQVVSLDGATPAAYNSEVRVTTTTTDLFTFEITGSPATPATGAAITVKAAPLGFEIAYTGTMKRAYRSSNVVGSRPYLRVDDGPNDAPGYDPSWAKFGKVTCSAGMSDIDTFVGARVPFDPVWPSSNEVSVNDWTGWYKWYYARREVENYGDSGAGPRNWVIVGDDRAFYFLTNMGSLIQPWHSRCCYFFGEFVSFKQGDAFGSLLCAHDRRHTASVASYMSSSDEYNYFQRSLNFVGKTVLGEYTQLGNSGVRAGFCSLNTNNTSTASGYNDDVPFPNGPDYSLLLHPVYIRQENGHMRGVMPGWQWVMQDRPFPDMTIIDGVVNYPGRKFIMPRLHYGGEQDRSQIALDIIGPWR